MSAGVSDQRMKGQGNQANGPKEHVNEHEDFDSWRAQHQGYTTQISTTMASDPYMPSYYGTSFPYQAFGVGDGTWSNNEPMTFLGSYGGQMGHDSYGMEGMFGAGFGGAGAAAAAAGYNYFHGNGDYSTWGANSAAMSLAQRKPHYDEHYYRHHDNPYQGVGMSEGVKGVEGGMQGLSLGEMGKGPDGKDMMKEGPPAQAQAKTWASIASQPAKPQPPLGSHQLKKKGPGMPPPPMVPGKHNMDIGTWENKNGGGGVKGGNVVRGGWGGAVVRSTGTLAPPATAGYRHPVPPTMPLPAPIPCPPPQPMHPPPPPPPQQQQQPPQMEPGPAQLMQHQAVSPVVHQEVNQCSMPQQSHPVLDELRLKNNYNPVDFDLSAESARFFVIKSYSEDDIHRSIKYEIWCSTEHGNKRLDTAFRERDSVPNGSVYLFFSVNGSGHFCGMARMMSPVDYSSTSSVWSQDKWKGQFRVRWIYVKDVPNVQLRHIRLENNENKPVTNSRDTQEVPADKGKQVLRVIHTYKHTTSIFDDFIHYERRQEEEDTKKQAAADHNHDQQPPSSQHSSSHHKERGDAGGGRPRGAGRGASRHH